MPRKKVVTPTVGPVVPEPTHEEEERTVAPAGPSTSLPTICFGARFLDGYVIRRLFELMKICCANAQIMPATNHIRIQSKNAKTASDSTFFSDSILFTQKLGAYEFHPPSADIDLLILNQAPLINAVHAMKDVRKKRPFTLSQVNGENRLRITEDNVFRDPDFVDLLWVCEPPVEPPAMDEDAMPNITQSVTEFCALFAGFLRRSKYVEATLFPDKMFCRGFAEEDRVVKEKWFRSESFTDFGADRLADEKPPTEGGTKFILPRKFISVIANIKPIPHEKSTIRIYHTADSPLKLSFDIGNVGVCNIYIRNEFKPK